MYTTTKWRKIPSIDEEPGREMIGADLVVNIEEFLLINIALQDLKYNRNYDEEDRQLASELVKQMQLILTGRDREEEEE